MVIEEKTIRDFLWKLKMLGDISLEEAEQIYSVIRSFSQAIRDVSSQKSTFDVSKIYSLLDKEYPIAALQDWRRTVARQISMGQKGNFIFSMSLEHGGPRLYEYWALVMKALEKHGSFEDRIISIRAVPKMYNSLPRYFQNLFKWEECEKMYILKGERVGFFYYPRRDPEGGKDFTIAQIFQKLFLFSAVISSEECSMFDAAERASKYLKQNALYVKLHIKKPPDKENVFYFNAKDVSMARTAGTIYALEYLKQNAPYIEVYTIASYGKETIIYTNMEGISMTKKVFEITMEELLENAIKHNVVNKDTAEEFLKHDGYIDHFPDEEFTEASLEYIGKRMKRQKEWKATQKIVEEEDSWLEVIR